MLPLRSCSHQFSWPRRSPEGEYYQVCLLCGGEYSYDWNLMRRLGRKPVAAVTIQPPERETRWKRRARRIHLSGPVRYRQSGTDEWHNGELKNISNAGVMFVGNFPIPEGTRVELGLDMPPEMVGGSTARAVTCSAKIVRTENRESGNVFGARILDYEFIGG